MDSWANTFAQIQDRPEKEFSEQDASILKQIVDAHPYFQPARLLYSRVLHALKSADFKTKLASLALHTYNREVLYNAFESDKEESEDKIDEFSEAPFTFSLQLHKQEKEPFKKKTKPSLDTAPYDISREYSSTPSAEPNLIDEFLNKNIGRLSYNQGMSKSTDYKDSLEESDDLVSETLAKIYIKQEKYKEAIALYERLILKEPSKSGYFARQISDLQKKVD